MTRVAKVLTWPSPMPAQQQLIQAAMNLAPGVTLGEAYRHVSSSLILEDFIQRLEPLGFNRESCSLDALNVLASSGRNSDKDQRRLLALCKLVVRVEKTRVRFTRDYWLTERNAMRARRQQD